MIDRTRYWEPWVRYCTTQDTRPCKSRATFCV